MCSNLFRKSVRKFGLTPVTSPLYPSILSAIFDTLAIPPAVLTDRRFAHHEVLIGVPLCTSKDDTTGIPNNLLQPPSVTSLASLERREYLPFPVFFPRSNFSISYLWRDLRIFISLIIEKSMTRAPISVVMTFRPLPSNAN